MQKGDQQGQRQAGPEPMRSSGLLDRRDRQAEHSESEKHGQNTVIA